MCFSTTVVYRYSYVMKIHKDATQRKREMPDSEETSCVLVKAKDGEADSLISEAGMSFRAGFQALNHKVPSLKPKYVRGV